MDIPARYQATGSSFDGGGMSAVVVYKDTHLDRLVVLKKLQSGTEKQRLLDELASLQAIRSKHVVQIYDVIYDDANDIAAIIEEYLPGKDLTKITPPTTAEEFLRRIYPIAEGIADIHAHNQVHRDIKPNNMKYDGENCLKIFDFGLSRNSAADAATTGIVGTQGFMAPELFVPGKDGKVHFTSAVDTYAFAITALSIMLPKLPKGIRAAPPSLPCEQANFAKLPISLATEIADLLNMCLALDPLDRPQMREVAQLLGLHLLKDRHRALLVIQGKTYVLDKTNRVVQLSVAGQGEIDVAYDGLRFNITSVSGDVSINNISASVGDTLPGSCVIILGHPNLGVLRTMLTADVSHPEVAI